MYDHSFRIHDIEFAMLVLNVFSGTHLGLSMVHLHMDYYTWL
jgi:hypothetical protein